MRFHFTPMYGSPQTYKGKHQHWLEPSIELFVVVYSSTLLII